jgi:hypothetical protein
MGSIFPDNLSQSELAWISLPSSRSAEGSYLVSSALFNLTEKVVMNPK